MSESTRIFIGSFTKQPDLYQLFDQAKAELNDTGKFKWTRTPDNLHLTFHFLGDTPIQNIALLQSKMADILDRAYPFKLQVSGLGFFKRKGNPSILYAKIEPNKDLFELFNQIQNILFENGFIENITSKFVPHITLARIKSVTPDFYQKLAKINEDFNKIEIHQVKPKIIVSHLSPEGALYLPLKK
jgi:2'-5' RNA ligase